MNEIPPHIIEKIKNSHDIVEVIKRDLPLQKSGNVWKACCPFHNEKTASFTVNPAGQFYKCFGCNAGGDVIQFLQNHHMLSFKEALERLSGSPVETKTRIFTFSDADAEHPPEEKPKSKAKKKKNAFAGIWDTRVEKITDEIITEVAKRRGIGTEIFYWLRSQKLIGVYNGDICFPVHDESGDVIRSQCKSEESGKWYYDPKGGSTPLVIGNIAQAEVTMVFESNWDAIATLHALRHYAVQDAYAAVVTRGANADMGETVKALSKAKCIIAVRQTDPEEKKSKQTGLTPAEQWLEKLKKECPSTIDFRFSAAPKEYKDPNDWIREKKPTSEEVEDLLIIRASAPDILPHYDINSLRNFPILEDPAAMIGIERRWLCRGGSLLIVGPSGAGKSTLMTSMGIPWALGKPWNGINVRRPLKQLVIQAENDQGDVAEMVIGSITGALGSGVIAATDAGMLNKNFIFVKCKGLVGTEFVTMLEKQIRHHRADVVWIDPVLSFIGGDISKQDVSSDFFRKNLDPMLDRTGCICVMLHHTGKPSSDGKGRKTWNVKELAYSGLGSSDLVNWSRAVCVLDNTEEKGLYRFVFAKRGERTGVVSSTGEKNADTIYIRHADKGLAWILADPPQEDSEPNAEKRKVTEYERNLRDIPIPAKWKEMVRSLMNVRHLSEKTATSLLNKAMAGGVITCPRRDGIWRRPGEG